MQCSKVPSIYDTTYHGVVADGETLGTDAIQWTINACTMAGGGKVRVPSGIYLSGTLSMRANAILSL